MRARRTPECNAVYALPGGNEDNDLHVERITTPDMEPLVISEWEFTPTEREAVAIGGRLQLIIHSHVVPPLGMAVVLRPSSGDVILVEPGRKTGGAALLLPAQAERLREWLGRSRSLLVRQQSEAETLDDANLIGGTIAEVDDLLHELRPLEERT